MDERLAYLKAVIEGHPDIEPWVLWCVRNDQGLASMLSRGEYLRLKFGRIKAIPELLQKYGIPYTPSDRYDWLGGKEGWCQDCGSPQATHAEWCPQANSRMFVTYRGPGRPRTR